MDRNLQREQWTRAGEIQLGCPLCPTNVPVGVLARYITGKNGQLHLELAPDMAEAWAHAWIHDPKINGIPGDSMNSEK